MLLRIFVVPYVNTVGCYCIFFSFSFFFYKAGMACYWRLLLYIPELSASIYSHLCSVLCLRRSDGSHQLVRDAVPADSRERVPQSSPSAARVPAGVRAPETSFLSQGTHSFPSIPVPSSSTVFLCARSKTFQTVQQQSGTRHDFCFLFLFFPKVVWWELD